MAPKKKKPRAKKGKGKDRSLSQPAAVPFVSEKEQYLQKEYAILSKHIQTYSQRVRHFQWENEFLDKEAKQIRDANKVYLSYLTRHSLRCQNAIISLNDLNRFDLAQIQKQKAEVAAQYLEKEKEVRRQLLELEKKLFLLNKEIESLQPWQTLQGQQLLQIRELEKELLITKIQLAEQMHKVKSRFLQQVAEYEWESQQKLLALAKVAEKESVRSLIQHTKQVKAGNWRLQSELLNLIKEAQVLKAFLSHLRVQQQHLLRERQCREDLARVRSWLQCRGPPQIITPGSSFRCVTSVKTKLAPSPSAQELVVKGPGPTPEHL